MSKILIFSFLAILSSQVARAECIDLGGGNYEGLSYCAYVVPVDSQHIRLERPILKSVYASGWTPLKPSQKRQLCRYFSNTNGLGKLRYVRGSLVKGVGNERPVDGNQQSELAGPGQVFSTIDSVECELR